MSEATWFGYETVGYSSRIIYQQIGIILYSLKIINAYPYSVLVTLKPKEITLRNIISSRSNELDRQNDHHG